MSGPRVLVVDPHCDPAVLDPEMAAWGLSATYVGSTLDALVEFGRLLPTGVLVASDARGVPAQQFIETARAQAECTFVVVTDGRRRDDPGPLLRAGAGAVVCRPYTVELVVEVLRGLHAPLDGGAPLRFGPLELDAATYSVAIEGRRLEDLPLREFEILQVLLGEAPRVVDDADLRRAIWGAEAAGPSDNAIAARVGSLRALLDGVARIRRIRGRGYSLLVD